MRTDPPFNLEEELKKAGYDDDNAKQMAFDFTIVRGLSAWAEMETFLVLLVSELLGTDADKTGLVLYSVMNFHTWLNTTNELLEFDDKFRSFRPQWTKISSTLRGLNDTRVRLAHHTMLPRNDDEIALRAPRYNQTTKWQKFAPLSPQDIYGFAYDALQIGLQIMDLVEAIHSLKNPGYERPIRAS